MYQSVELDKSHLQPSDDEIRDVPVLVIAYKKVETVRLVVDGLRHCMPKKVYVALNAPIEDSEEEIEICRQVEEVFQGIDWGAEVAFLRRTKNLPVALSYFGACDWFFDQVEAGIVLDDDCVPSPDFFRLVAFFKKNRSEFLEVGHINGTQFLCDEDLSAESRSFFPTRYASCWGWATWQGEWKGFERDLRTRITQKELWELCLQNCGDKLAARKVFWILDSYRERSLEGKVAPDWLWSLHLWAKTRQVVSPATNLVRNIGIGSLDGVTSEWTDRNQEASKSTDQEASHLTRFERKLVAATRRMGRLPEMIYGDGSLKVSRDYDRRIAKLYASVPLLVRWRFHCAEILRVLRRQTEPF